MSANFEFNDQLIRIIQDRVSIKSLQVDMLMNIISLGKEAAYRRLRGEVLFTFEEACKIADKLGFSLDSIAKNPVRKDKLLFELLPAIHEGIENYVSYYLSQLIAQYDGFKSCLDDCTPIFAYTSSRV